MGKKFNLLLGVGVGYILGSRAGRARYEQILRAASKVRNSNLVAKPLDRVGERAAEAIRHQGEVVTDKVADAVKERLFGAPNGGSGTSRGEYIDVEVIEETTENND
ncbi:protoporphyrinogen oxidase [Boudabousia marimammalium]|uniref:Protoporphyrinogen oxidase n=1 Tax=Boudabousia marimammalium TaxID=156892 RepID=A0A1Q5PSE9_9ACTO|nr:protoporphyrinogen oxidase [Boudabousia marimammalium]OKL50508.1 protoporphyrinogen oxidase [Boudabousia marimammalium]